jgi:hypothetical protein
MPQRPQSQKFQCHWRMVTRLTDHSRLECDLSSALDAAVDDGADPKRQLSWMDADHLQTTG